MEHDEDNAETVTRSKDGRKPVKVFKGVLEYTAPSVVSWYVRREDLDCDSWCVRQDVLAKKGFDPLDYLETDGSDFAVFDIPKVDYMGRDVLERWLVYEVFDEEKTKAGLIENMKRSVEDAKLAATEEQLIRIDEILDRLLPDGIQGLSNESLQVLDDIIRREAYRSGGYDNLTEPQLGGCIKLMGDVWCDAFPVMLKAYDEAKRETN